MTGRPRTCECGDCGKCKNRERQRRWYAKQSTERRRELIANRDLERVRANDRARYYRDPEKRQAATKEWVERNSARSNQIKMGWRARNDAARYAHHKVYLAVKSGRLMRQPCEECDAEPTEAHHDDYSKPLDVRWFCSKHHGVIRRKSF